MTKPKAKLAEEVQGEETYDVPLDVAPKAPTEAELESRYQAFLNKKAGGK